jgi:hypothetical protein
MIDPHRPVGWIEASNEERENDGSSGSYESPPDPYHQPKKSDLLAHRMRITCQKKRYTSIRN